MDRYKSLINNFFELDQEGHTIFVGLGRAGYIVDDATEAKVRNFLHGFCFWFLPICATGAVIGARFSLLIPLIALVASVLWYQVQLSQILSSSPKSKHRRSSTLRQRLDKQAASTPLSQLWQTLAGVIGLLLVAVWLIMSSSSLINLVIGIVGAMFSSLSIASGGYMILWKLRHKQEGG